MLEQMKPQAFTQVGSPVCDPHVNGDVHVCAHQPATHAAQLRLGHGPVMGHGLGTPDLESLNGIKSLNGHRDLGKLIAYLTGFLLME